MTRQLDARILTALTRGGFVREGHFSFSNGRHGGALLDLAHLTTDPDAVSHMCYAIAKHFFTAHVQTVASPSIQGAGLALWVASYLDPKARVVPAELTVNGPAVPANLADLVRDRRVLIVDDLIVTGDLVQPLAHSIVDRGGEVVGIATLWNTGEAELDGFPVHGLLNTVHDVVRANDCQLCARRVELVEAGY